MTSTIADPVSPSSASPTLTYAPVEKLISKQILTVLMETAKTSSKKKKEQTLRDFTTHAGPTTLWTWKRVLKYAMDKFIRFGISVPDGLVANPKGTLEISDDSVWRLFDELAHTAGAGSLAEKTQRVIDVFTTLNEDAFAIAMVVLDKDLGTGVGEKVVNKIIPGLLSTFNVQLAAKFESKRLKSFPVAIEPKYDGMRVMCRTTSGGAVTFYTRNGNTVDTMNGFVDRAMALREAVESVCPIVSPHDIWFDGELTSGGSFNESISAGRKKSEQMTEGTFTVFDLVIGDLVNDDDSTLAFHTGTYKERRQRLQQAFKCAGSKLNGACLIDISPVYWCSSEQEIESYYERFRARRLEGAIVKLPDGLYLRKRSPNWMKLKACETADLKIKGAFEGEGAIAGQLGGFIVDYKGVDVRVGGGFTAQQRVEFWEAFQSDLKLIEAGERRRCQIIDSLAEVEYQEITPDGSLRHPVFVRLRRDKIEVSF